MVRRDDAGTGTGRSAWEGFTPGRLASSSRRPGRRHQSRARLKSRSARLVAATRALRNRRFDEQAIVAIFALAAWSQMSWKELVRAVRDLIARDNARLADLES